MKAHFLKTIALTTTLLASAISAVAFAESSVWKVSKGSDHIYIGGTVHILPVSEFPLPTEFTDAYEASDAIVLEAKLPEPTDITFQTKMMQKMSYTNGQTLATVLSKSTYKQLSDYIATFGADINTLNGFKPGFIVTMMAMMEAQRAQIAGDGVDAYFNQLAVKQGKDIAYLESADFQLDMLASMGQGDEDSFVKMNLAQMKDFKTMFDDMLAAWRKGDTAKLEEVVIKPMQEDPKTFKTMIVDRNKNWIPLIEAMFSDNDREFVLVGVGHLIGEDNVISLLKKQGYSVSKL
ncbi:TraB/GumN family protein [Litorilituus sediminis]|uniref:TraB/GumN family protein n=1 Tax=Litorilituus sediminis TaxID=718192 RepID=A0A4P6P3Z0_9GAMM|nr:TraB/GumN family protein [Litorilituus sediminis]QBG36014.1 TraB/GumN family protein [Litorilituus sediminis]